MIQNEIGLSKFLRYLAVVQQDRLILDRKGVAVTKLPKPNNRTNGQILWQTASFRKRECVRFQSKFEI